MARVNEAKYNEMISNSDYINQNSYTINKKYIKRRNK